jgi:ribonuclease BN (tRNA processing enzyme)
MSLAKQITLAASKSIVLLLGTLYLLAVNAQGVHVPAASTVLAMKSRIITIGTAGGPVPRPQRSGIATLITVGDTHYLVDAGEGVVRQLSRIGLDPKSVRTVFFTHLHDDHTAGLPALVGFGYAGLLPSPINLYGPPQTQRMTKGLIDYLAVNTELRVAGLNLQKPLDAMLFGHDSLPGVIYKDANITVTAVENTHYHAESKAHKSYSLRFELPDRTVVFTGDTGPSEAVTRLATGADLLFAELVDVEPLIERRRSNGSWARMSEVARKQFISHQESEHLTAQEIAKLATSAGVKSVVMTHLTFRADDDYSIALKTVAAGFSGKSTIANDMDAF